MPPGTLVLSLALFNSTFATPQTLDFESKACNVGEVLEKLSEASGQRLKAATSIADEIVFVHARGVEPHDLKAKIAEAMEASWVKKSDAEYLDRTPAQEKALWNRHLALRRKFVDAEMARIRKQLEDPFDGKTLANGLSSLKQLDDVRDNPAASRDNYVRERMLFSQGPLARLLNRLVLACDPNDLAAIGPYERRIFDPSPTLMQKLLNGKKYAAALDAFSQEQQQWIDAAEKTAFPERPDGAMVSDPRAQIRINPSLRGFYLEIQRGEMTALFNVNLRAKQEAMGRNDVLTQAMFEDPARRFLDSQIAPPTPEKDDPPVELSEISNEFQKTFVESMSGATRPTPTPEVVQFFLSPDKNEPLGLLASDALRGYASLHKLNIVAALPDEILGWSMFIASRQQLRTNQFVQGLVNAGSLDSVQKDGWALFSPSDRYESQLNFTTRASVAKLMKAVTSKGRLDLRDHARYAYESGRISRFGLGDYYLMMWDRSLLSSFDRTSWDGLRLYGSFTDDQQRALEEGSKFLMLGLKPSQKRIVEKIVYSGEIESSEYMGGQSAGRMSTKAPVEPTEEFAGGLPPGGAVLAKVKSTPILAAYGKGGDGKVRPLRNVSVWTIASIELDFVGNHEQMRRYGVAGLVGYAPAQEKIISLRVELAPGLWKESPMTLMEHDPDAKPVAWDKLPEPLRKQIADAMEQNRKQKAERKPSVPPPD